MKLTARAVSEEKRKERVKREERSGRELVETSRKNFEKSLKKYLTNSRSCDIITRSLKSEVEYEKSF